MEQYENKVLEVLKVAKCLYDALKPENFEELNGLRKVLDVKKKEAKKDLSDVECLIDVLILKYQTEHISEDEIEETELKLSEKKSNYTLKLENIVDLQENILAKYDEITVGVATCLYPTRSLNNWCFQLLKSCDINDIMNATCRRKIIFYFTDNDVAQVILDDIDFGKIFEEIDFGKEIYSCLQLLHLKMFSTNEIKKVWEGVKRIGKCLDEARIPLYLEVKCLRD